MLDRVPTMWLEEAIKRGYVNLSDADLETVIGDVFRDLLETRTVRDTLWHALQDVLDLDCLTTGTFYLCQEC